MNATINNRRERFAQFLNICELPVTEVARKIQYTAQRLYFMRSPLDEHRMESPSPRMERRLAQAFSLPENFLSMSASEFKRAWENRKETPRIVKVSPASVVDKVKPQVKSNAPTVQSSISAAMSILLQMPESSEKYELIVGLANAAMNVKRKEQQ